MTNVALRVYDKANGNVVFSTPDIFRSKMNLQYDRVVDQRIRFDRRSQRWIAIGIVNVGNSQSGFLVGASATSDPTGAWKGFFLKADPAGQFWCDYPLLGIDDSAVYLSAQLIPLSGGSKTFGLFTIPKADVLAATPTGGNATRLRFADSVARIPDPQTDYAGRTGDGTLSILQPWSVGSEPGVRCTKWNVSGASGPGATL